MTYTYANLHVNCLLCCEIRRFPSPVVCPYPCPTRTFRRRQPNTDSFRIRQADGWNSGEGEEHAPRKKKRATGAAAKSRSEMQEGEDLETLSEHPKIKERLVVTVKYPRCEICGDSAKDH